MAILAKTLLSAVTVVGAGAGVDLVALSRSVTFQVISTTDPAPVVEFDGSLDNANWFSLGQLTGTGAYSVDADVIQYARANVIKIASGAITAYCGNVSG